MTSFTLRKQASKLVLAIALATGTAMVAGHIAPDEAHAQRKKKKDKKDKDAGKPQYSKEFVAAFTALDEASKAEGADIPALRSRLDEIFAMATSGDEKFQSGLLAYNMGVKDNNLELRLLGMETMLASGKTPPESVGQYNFIAFQTASVLEQHEKSRDYLQKAIDLGYSGDGTQSDLLVAMAQTYFNTDEYPRGLQYLDQAIAAKKAAGEPVEERLFDIAFSVSYREDLQPQVYDYAVARAQMFPTDANWTNAINVVRVLNEYGPQPTLDILRLSRMVGVLDDKQEYIIYVETADARRLPQEVKDVIEQGYAIGAIERDDTYISDQLRIANERIPVDREELPALEADARAADASFATVRAAGSAFLSYGEFAKAVEFYQKALGLAGGDTGETLTRLGIAQVGLEDYDAAQATLAKVTGDRAPIAKVWAGYAGYLGADSASAASADAAAPATEAVADAAS
ncbi:MAG: hypothetical protein QNI87_04440 [Erythrobacter sp.]|uniref:hypothetical protein n=1 Tax=Erythrobacter sp. TaxID=1042 RepID=UPI00260DAB7A|nr:hypothetical protein [Erythrobacter sp.]MDJ0977763.1 hypothetical protein [Erythrobacter sp.]